MRVTLRDVAERSQVSISTASRALNGRSDVRKEVQERVLAAARELQYTANQHARALREGHQQDARAWCCTTRARPRSTARCCAASTTPPRRAATASWSATPAHRSRPSGRRTSSSSNGASTACWSTRGSAAPNRSAASLGAGMPFVVLNRRVDDADGVDADYVLIEAEQRQLSRHPPPDRAGPRAHPVPHPRRAAERASLERSPGYRRALAEYGIPFAPELRASRPRRG